MKKYTPTFLETLFANLFFWGLVYGVFYFLKRGQIKWMILFVSISLIYAVLAALKDFMKKKSKIGSYITLGFMGLINLSITSASLVMILRYFKQKNYILLGLFILIAIIYYYKFDQLFNKDEKNKQ